MTVNNELKTAIYSELTSDSTFNTAIGGRVYYQGKENATYPYIVYSFFSDNHDYDSASNWEIIYVQFSLYSDELSSEEIGNLEAYLIDAFNTVSLSNYTLIELTRTNKRYFIDENKNTIIEYRIILEHN